MNEVTLFYVFVGLMVLNIFATFLYLMGLNQMRVSVRRAYRNYTKTPSR